ncbi:MAG: amino acid deaminase/aldolase [Actinomycetota bacterium]
MTAAGAGESVDYADYRRAFEGRAMPFAYLNRDLLDQNLREIVARAGQTTVRVATKSIRSEAITRHILAADPRIQGLMCYTAPEAVHLADRGFDDILVAYPTWEPTHVDAVARAVASGKSITLMVDSVEHVQHLDAIAARESSTIPVCIDVDMSLDLPGLRFGVWRSPIRTAKSAATLAQWVASSEHLSLEGIMGYEAQVAGLPDRIPGQTLKNPLVRRLKKASISRVAARRAAVVRAVREVGPLRFVNGGGTGSVASTSAEDVVTEVTVGSGFYSPTLFDHYDDFRYAPAVGFAIQIVRQPTPDIYTCLGGGYIASGAVGPEKQPEPYLPHGARLLPTEGTGEVQTPIRYRGPERLRLGDPIFLRHAKAGELCERFTHLLVLSGGRVVDEVTTYRGDGLSFL